MTRTADTDISTASDDKWRHFIFGDVVDAVEILSQAGLKPCRLTGKSSSCSSRD